MSASTHHIDSNGVYNVGGQTISGSHLQISVEPVQASFFAGEEFACIITFTNTRIPVPQTQPLPDRPTFDSLSRGGQGDEEGEAQKRRVVSTSAADTATSSSASAGGTSKARQIPLPLPIDVKRASQQQANGTDNFLAVDRQSASSAASTPSPSSRKPHRKSQSVDIRTFTRRHQLERNLPLDTEVSDEHYYRTLSLAANADDEFSTLQAQELLDSLPGRRRLIGKNIAGQATSSNHSTPQPDAGTKSAKRHTKSYSVAVPGEHVSNQDQPDGLGKGYPRSNRSDFDESGPFASPRIPSHHVRIDAMTASPVSSRVSSTASTRKPSGTIAASHPHSRKKSVAQVQAENLTAAFHTNRVAEADSMLDGSSSSSTFNSPRTSLDQRSKHGQGESFYGIGENSTMESVLREDITQLSRLGPNGYPRTPTKNNGSMERNAFSQNSGKETILWTFAQFGGHFQVDESLVKPGEFEQVKQRLVGGPLNANLVPGMTGNMHGAVGGGQLGATADGEEQATNDGWGSYLRRVLSSGGGGKASHLRSGSTLLHNRQKTMESRTIPVLSFPPSMVAVDLELAPGEQRSFAWRIPLPPDLPPSYMGRAISFHYTLTLGTNRLVRDKRGKIEQKSRLVRIPMRIYNHVNLSGVTAFYDLTNPIINRRDEAIVLDEFEEQDMQNAFSHLTTREGEQYVNRSAFGPRATTSRMRRRRSSGAETAADKALLQYAKELSQSCHEKQNAFVESVEQQDEAGLLTAAVEMQRAQDGARTSPSTMRAHLALPPHSAHDAGFSSKGRRLSDPSQAGLGILATDDDDLPKNSMQAVEILSRNSQKVSYDISKDGQVAATLTLVKSKYRLGDTVMGVVTINTAHSIARVVRFAATLETHEEIEATLSTLPAGRVQRLTRVVHASCHDATLDSGQASFTLAVPSGATPNFDTSAVRLAWTIRLAFLTQSCVRDANTSADRPRDKPAPHLTAGVDDGYGVYHRALRAVSSLANSSSVATSGETKLEVVECAVPLTILPHSTRFTAGEVAFVA